jgi:hypothetical protein
MRDFGCCSVGGRLANTTAPEHSLVLSHIEQPTKFADLVILFPLETLCVKVYASSGTSIVLFSSFL